MAGKKRWGLLILALCFHGSMLNALGVSFNYFLPKGGSFSAPIPPIGLDDLGFTMGKHLGISTGLSLYNIAGLKMTGVPFEVSDNSFCGILSLSIPLYVKIIIPLKKVRLDIHGGGFVFYPFTMNPSADLVNDIGKSMGYSAFSADLNVKNSAGFGWRAGLKMTIALNKQMGLMLGGYTMSGTSKLWLTGTYQGASATKPFTEGKLSLPSAKLDHTGTVLMLGVEIKT